LPLGKLKARGWPRAHPYQTMLFDLQDDPGQERPIDDPSLERMMIDHMIRLMRENDTPPEQFERLGLPS
jgi:hypothetical protein